MDKSQPETTIPDADDATTTTAFAGAPERALAALEKGVRTIADGSRQQRHWWLTRFFLLRATALIYAVAFLVQIQQGMGLLGEDGLLPVQTFLDWQRAEHGGQTPVLELPTLFWLDASDATLHALAWFGFVLSLAVLAGLTHAVAMAVLWALYLSFVNVGQIWFAFGWESLLLELGFLAIWLAPTARATVKPFSPRPPPSPVIVLLVRWVLFRVMFGAGLIKLRGDPCWDDLTCLAYHYETQPVPNPLSRTLHHMPMWFHELGVAFNHFVELVVPWFVFGPRKLRHIAGGLLIAFQLTIIVSGNLSWLNWLTIVLVIACFDDGALRNLWPRALTPEHVRESWTSGSGQRQASAIRRGGLAVLALTIGVLSIAPVSNLVSPKQKMNATFDAFHLVNTYGAFGTVGRERYELVIEGTMAETPDERAEWRAYRFPCKPGPVDRTPCLITPYHHRLDWLMWFAAMFPAPKELPALDPRWWARHPHAWLIHLVHKLLHAEPAVLDLLEDDPFDGARPAWIRVERYRYRFAPPDAGAVWRREHVDTIVPPVERGDPRLLHVLALYGWVELEGAVTFDP